MSRRFTQGKLQGQERSEVIQEVQKQAKAAAIAAIKPVITAFLQAEQTAKLGREKGQSRRGSAQPREIDWHCGQCGCRDAHQFTRDGHYRRALATGWGLVEGLQIPMLECQCCGHDVICSFAIAREISALLAGFGSTGALKPRGVPKSATGQPRMECSARQERGITHDQ